MVGAVAQQFARSRPAVVSKLILGCTYACNTSTLRERLECEVFAALLRISSPATLGKLIVRPSKSKPTGAIGLTRQQAEWLRTIMSANPAPAMRGAVRGAHHLRQQVLAERDYSANARCRRDPRCRRSPTPFQYAGQQDSVRRGPAGRSGRSCSRMDSHVRACRTRLRAY